MRYLVLALLLGGCVDGAQRALACHHEAGPQPYAAAGVFGPLGVIAVSGEPETLAYNARYQRCMSAQKESMK